MRPNTPDMQAAAQWMQMWQELFRTWMGYAAPVMQNMPGMGAVPGLNGMPWLNGMGANPFGQGVPAAPPPYPPTGHVDAPAELDIELETAQRVAISVHIARRGSVGVLSARLHRDDGTETLDLEFDPRNIRIAVPDAQRPGTYSGVIRDACGSQCGMLTLTVFHPHGASA